MRTGSAFLFGALAGAFALLTAQRFLEDYDQQKPVKLTKSLDERIQELEERLAETPESEV